MLHQTGVFQRAPGLHAEDVLKEHPAYIWLSV